jgi:peptide chain release factor 3
MGRFVALLRGINVGGHARVPMAELRAACAAHGLGEVRTYIQSGNIVGEADDKPEAIERAIEALVRETFDLQIPVIVRTADQWAALAGANPFPEEAASSPNRVMACLAQRPLAHRTLFHWNRLKGRMIDLEEGRFVSPDGTISSDAPGVEALAARYADSQNITIRTAMEGLDLARESLPAFDRESYLAGHLTPVYFGSALKSVGVKHLLEAVCRFAPSPRPQPARPEPVDPSDDKCTGFVFKVQANMDPNHRDRVAFVRVASGTLKRGMRLKNVRSGKDLKVANPMFFFARERELADEALAGDVVGIPNHGTLSVGDTLTDGPDVTVTGIPNFAPELLRRVHLSDASKTKQLAKALNDLAEEGVVQVFKPSLGAGYYVGAVGPLQLEVLTSRAQAEYAVPIRIEPAQYVTARWVKVNDPVQFEKFAALHRLNIAEDRYGDPVFLAPSQWEIDRCAKDFPELGFMATKDRGEAA